MMFSLLTGHFSFNHSRKVKGKRGGMMNNWRDFHFPFQYHGHYFPISFLKIIFLLSRTKCLNRSCVGNLSSYIIFM